MLSTTVPGAAADPWRLRPTRRKRPHRTKKQQVASTLYNLQLDVNDLRQQIHELCLRRALLLHPRSLLASPCDPDGSSYKKVRKLFGLFNRGYQVPDAAGPRAYTEALTGDVALFTQWRQHAQVFAARRCEVRAIRVVSTNQNKNHDDHQDEDEETVTACVVRVEGLSHGAFTRACLARFFPAVLDDPQLTQSLLGRAMAKPMVFHFEFNARGRVVRFSIEPDFFAALAQALDDPFRAAAILNAVPSSSAVQKTSRKCRQKEAEPIDTQRITVLDESHDPAMPLVDPRHAVAFLLSS